MYFSPTHTAKLADMLEYKYGEPHDLGEDPMHRVLSALEKGAGTENSGGDLSQRILRAMKVITNYPDENPESEDDFMQIASLTLTNDDHHLTDEEIYQSVINFVDTIISNVKVSDLGRLFFSGSDNVFDDTFAESYGQTVCENSVLVNTSGTGDFSFGQYLNYNSMTRAVSNVRLIGGTINKLESGDSVSLSINKDSSALITHIMDNGPDITISSLTFAQILGQPSSSGQTIKEYYNISSVTIEDESNDDNTGGDNVI